jgi:hypothetical protein
MDRAFNPADLVCSGSLLLLRNRAGAFLNGQRRGIQSGPSVFGDGCGLPFPLAPTTFLRVAARVAIVLYGTKSLLPARSRLDQRLGVRFKPLRLTRA